MNRITTTPGNSPLAICFKIFIAMMIFMAFPPVGLVIIAVLLVKLVRRYGANRAWARQQRTQAYWASNNAVVQRHNSEVARAFRSR